MIQTQHRYIMENDEEARRLDLKTDEERLRRQALWAGLTPGMRVADVGCGSGKTSGFLRRLVGPGGEVVGIDASGERIAHARAAYAAPGLTFVCRDFYQPLEELGRFDFIWVRFVLEYHAEKSQEIVANLKKLLNPGGILCLVDLDHNCLSHFGIPQRLQRAMEGVMERLKTEHDFDPYAGRKLYSYLYDLGCEGIEVDLTHHHLIYGTLSEVDDYNWTRKVEVAAQSSGYRFEEYDLGYEGFRSEFRAFFSDPRRFSYTPLICCAGRNGARQ